MWGRARFASPHLITLERKGVNHESIFDNIIDWPVLDSFLSLDAGE
jgi:hypothetical protein